MYSVLIPFILGILLFKKINNYLLILLILLFFSFITDFTVYKINESRVFVWPIISVLQFALLMIVFILNTNYVWKRKILLFSIPLFIIYAVFYIFILKDKSQLFPNLMTLTLFGFLIISISSFIEIYNNVEHNNLFKYPFFWINVAVLIYFSGNLFLTLSYNIFTMDNVFQLYIPIHSTLNTAKNLLFAMAFIVNFYPLRKESLS